MRRLFWVGLSALAQPRPTKDGRPYLETEETRDLKFRMFSYPYPNPYPLLKHLCTFARGSAAFARLHLRSFSPYFLPWISSAN